MWRSREDCLPGMSGNGRLALQILFWPWKEGALMVFKKKGAPAPAKPKYLFGKAARQLQAAKAKAAEETDTTRLPKPQPPRSPAPEDDQYGWGEQKLTQRLTRKMQMMQPPNIPSLRFDAVAGRGGMAVVWRAWHTDLQRNVAVKVMNREFATSGQDVRQFMLEVRTMTSLHHPGIVQGYGADCVDGRYYFVMDYVDGYTLGSLLHRKARLPETDALVIGESVADAMSYAWSTAKIVHCDIKPDNIMVDRDGTVKITDLGLCQSTAFIAAARDDEVVGTPAYISPEQVYANGTLDCRADIYSLGATLYHLTTGRMLFPDLANDDILRAHVDPDCQAPDPRTLAPSLSPSFCNLLAGMLVKDKDYRYQTWDDVYETVQVLENGGQVPPLNPAIVSSVKIEA